MTRLLTPARRLSTAEHFSYELLVLFEVLKFLRLNRKELEVLYQSGRGSFDSLRAGMRTEGLNNFCPSSDKT